MWQISIFLTAIMLALPGQAGTQQVEGLEFERVLVHGNVKVEISQGDTVELVLRGEASDLGKQPFFVDDDTLVLGHSRNHRSQSFSGVKFKLTVPQLHHLQLKGSGEVYVRPMQIEDMYAAVEGSGNIKLFDMQGGSLLLRMSGSGDIHVAKLNLEKLEIQLSGSGDIFLGELVAGQIETSINGSGDIKTQDGGSAKVIEMNIVGSGDIDFTPVDIASVEVNIMGSGTARVGVVERLDVNIMGSGDVHYRGDPDVDQSILGSGDLRREN